MIELWLRSGMVGIILVPCVLLYLIAGAIVWLTHLSPARPFFASCIGIAGPFFASVAVLFSLFAAFCPATSSIARRKQRRPCSVNPMESAPSCG
jgi:hypothetical protein